MMGDPESNAAAFIKKTKSGWVVKNGDSKAFTDLIESAYRNPKMLEPYGQNVLEIIKSEYTTECVGQMYNQLIGRLVNGQNQ
jgi:glycosyltransferase involved in cell wall biosynthesis